MRIKMIEFDKLLAEMKDKRFMLNNNVNRLSAENPKLYKKISHLFEDIIYWMESSEIYIDNLKKSIDTLEVKKENNAYYMNRPRNILDTGKKDV